MTHDEGGQAWSEIELYFERVIPKAVRDHAMTEGVVQMVVGQETDHQRLGILDREVTPSFRDAPYKAQVLPRCMDPSGRSPSSPRPRSARFRPARTASAMVAIYL